ncbi:MAG: peptidoglycan-binding protein [Clostridia bacterium]|nr:peptidoglycan-binding protein [Clostridia bacterium]
MAVVVTPSIPQYITVHLGAPDSNAQNVTVSFPQYIKNVASSEIYPTWNESAIYANIYAQISYALNRVYTNFYPSRGYDFDITSSTAYDQKFIQGRTIFENISRIVDQIFTTYIRRIGRIEPLAAKYCNGTTVTCEGLSQWGSEYLARQGYNSMGILQYYYGDDIELVEDTPITDIQSLYPGYPLRRGDSGDPVTIIQRELNTIGRNYPAIPRVDVDGIFGESTERAVRTFQQIFDLTPDGIVGQATWNRLVMLYVGILRLAELDSVGVTIFGSTLEYPEALRLGDENDYVATLQYFLSVISEFYDTVPTVPITGYFGELTQDAVIAFQRTAGLVADGVVGRRTWDELYRAYDGVQNTVLIPDINLRNFPGTTISTNS